MLALDSSPRRKLANELPNDVYLEELGRLVIRLLKPNEPLRADVTMPLPPGQPLTNPFWLTKPPGKGLYAVEEPSLVGRPEAPAPLVAGAAVVAIMATKRPDPAGDSSAVTVSPAGSVPEVIVTVWLPVPERRSSRTSTPTDAEHA